MPRMFAKLPHISEATEAQSLSRHTPHIVLHF